MEEVDWNAFVMRGQAARRTVHSYGWSYDFGTQALKKIEPMPPLIVELRDRAAALTDLPQSAFEHALVTRYPPGATIGWHRDASAFGPTIIGISLRTACRMRFRYELEGVRYVHDQTLEPRSAYVL